MDSDSVQSLQKADSLENSMDRGAWWAAKDWGQEEKRATKDEMVGRHHRF